MLSPAANSRCGRQFFLEIHQDPTTAIGVNSKQAKATAMGGTVSGNFFSGLMANSARGFGLFLCKPSRVVVAFGGFSFSRH